MGGSGPDGNCGTNTVGKFNISGTTGWAGQTAKATARNEKMRLITTWHCTEILQGEESETTPREWLILAGPGEDLIFEVKSARRPTNKPNQTRH